MLRKTLWTVLISLLAGCAGDYRMTTPDAVGPVDGAAPVTVRLERNEFWFWHVAAQEAAITFTLEDPENEPLRAAYTGRQGYASVALPVPPEMGQHDYFVHHMDREGDEAAGTGRLWVLQPRLLVMAVTLESLRADKAGAAESLRRLDEWGVQIVYLTREGPRRTEALHSWLEREGFPAGAIVSWDWDASAGRVMGTLPSLREQMPSMVLGVGRNRQEGRALGSVDMAVVLVDGKDSGYPRLSWGELTERLFAARELLEIRDFRGVTPGEVAAELRLSSSGPPIGGPAPAIQEWNWSQSPDGAAAEEPVSLEEMTVEVVDEQE